MTEPVSKPQIDELLAHRGWVRRLCRHLAASPADADEVEQETWRRALEAPPKHGSNLKAWFGAVVRSAAMQRRRGESRRQGAHDRWGHAVDLRKGVSEEPGSLLERRETFRALSRLVGELEEPFGEVVYLRYVEGLPPRAIAKQLGLPVDLVKSRQHRGLKLLRQRVQREFGADWRARCLVFVPTLPELAASSVMTIAMTKTTKLLVAAVALVVSIPLLAQLVAEPENTDLETPRIEAQAEVPELIADVESESVTVADRELVEPKIDPAEFVEEAGPRVRIQVRDFETREPVPFAEVLVLDPGRAGFRSSSYLATKLRGEHSSKQEQVMREFGIALQANENGVAILERMHSREVSVAATTATHFHVDQWIEGDWEDEVWDLDLLLRPRRHLLFEVRDAHGELVPDLPVSWMMRRGTSTWYGAYMKARTDEEGRGTFFDLQTRSYVFAEQDQQSFLVANVASSEPVAVRFDPRDLTGETVVLRLPATIEVTVGIPEKLQSWMQQGVRAGLSNERDPSGREVFLDRLVNWSAIAESEYREGKVVFPYVEPGFEGTLLLQLPWLPQVRGIVQAVTIPVTAIGQHHIEAYLPEYREGIELQFLDKSGAPIARDFEVKMVPMRPDIQGAETVRVLQREEESRYFRENEEWVRSAPRTRPYFANLWSYAEAGDYSRRHHFHAFSFDAAALDTDPRVLTMELENELLVSGKVVDQNGRALKQVQVQLEGTYQRIAESNSLVGATLVLATDREGRFEVRGTRGLLERMRLVKSDARVFRDVPFVEGKADQVFELVLPAELQGEVLADPEVPLASLGVFLLDAERDQLIGRMEIQSTTGRLRMANLVARGGVDAPVVLVLRDSFNREVFRSDAFSMAEPGELRPESLNPIDLRGKLHVFAIEAVGEAGESCGAIELWEDGAKAPQEAAASVALVSARSAVQVVIDAEGYQASDLLELTDEHRVELRRGIPFTVELPPHSLFERKDVNWIVRCESAESTNQTRLRRERIVQGRATELSLPFAGAWRVYLECQLAGNSKQLLRPVDRRAKVLVESRRAYTEVFIPQEAANHSVLIQPTQVALEEAVAGLIE